MKPVCFLPAILLLACARVSWAAPVSIQVLGPDKKPVPGAKIRVRLWGDEFQVRGRASEASETRDIVADDKGTAQLDSLTTGTSSLRGAVGVAAAWSPSLSIGAVGLQEGANTISLSEGGTARGLVVDDKGQPVENALVRLVGAAPAQSSSGYKINWYMANLTLGPDFETRTGKDGRWSLGRLPLNGTATVNLADEKFALARASSVIAPDNEETKWDAIALEARSAVSAGASAPTAISLRPSLGAILIARPPASFSGRVLDVKGAPVEGVLVSAISVDRNVLPSDAPATSDANGEWKLGRLSGGEYNVNLTVPAKSRDKIAGVPEDGAPVKVAPGASTSVGDIKLVEGGEVVVRFVDAATGKGIKGARAYTGRIQARRTSYAFLPLDVSDAEGKSVIKLAPGKYNIGLVDPPEGYVNPPRVMLDSGEDAVEVKAGSSVPFEFKLKKGVSLTGRILDQAGKPVPNFNFSFRDAGEGWGSYTSVRSDAKGVWKTSGLNAGALKLSSQNEEWKLVSPKDVKLPRGDTLDITVAPLAQFALTGRVVDDKGSPLEGTNVTLQVATLVDNMGFHLNRVAMTDAKGEWRVESIPETANSIKVTVSRPGFAVEKVAKASKDKGNVWAATEAVLKKRDAHLSGFVRGAGGQPVAGAQVLASSTLATGTSGPDGRWKFEALPGGEVEVVAVAPVGVAVASTSAPRDDLPLSLKTPSVAKARDVEGAQAVAEEAWQSSRGTQYGSRPGIAAVLAAADPDAALLLARGAEAKVPHRTILSIVGTMLREGEAGKAAAEDAAAWAQGNLDAIENAGEKTEVILSISEALAPHDIPEAKKWLALARASYPNLTGSWQKMRGAIKLAVVAARLDEADADEWFDTSLKIASEKTEGMMDFATPAWEAAAVRPAWVRRAIEAAIKAAPEQPQYSQGPESVVAQAIRRMATVNLAEAKSLLEKYGNLKGRYGSDHDMGQTRGQVLGARAKAGEDVDALVKEAEVLSWQPQIRALGLIALNGPPARKAELLKKTYEAAATHQGVYVVMEALPALRYLLPLDREFVKSKLESLRARFDAPRDEMDDYGRSRGREVAAWAWLQKEVDPASARWAIEREWAIGISLPPSREDDWSRWSGMSQLALAMAPLDTARALQLAARLPVTGHNGTSFEAQRSIARWMIADASDRTSRSFSFWNSDFEHESRYSNEW